MNRDYINWLRTRSKGDISRYGNRKPQKVNAAWHERMGATA